LPIDRVALNCSSGILVHSVRLLDDKIRKGDQGDKDGRENGADAPAELADNRWVSNSTEACVPRSTP